MTEPSKAPLPLRGQKAFQVSWLTILKQWVLPGWGYWELGDKTRARAFFFIWLIFALLGVVQLWVGGSEAGALGGIFMFESGSWLKSLGALGTLGLGPLYLPLAYLFGGSAAEPIRNLTQEYGSSYLFIMGLLNWLSFFDLFDRRTGRWYWRLPKDERN
jgi:hypothetical protein